MKILDILQLSTRIFKTNKMRTILTVLGIGVGIGAILFLVSLGYGLQKIILDKIASSDSLLALDIVSGTSKELRLDQPLIEKMVKNPLVAEVSPLVSFNSLIDVNNFNGGAEVEFVKSSFFTLSGLELEMGKFFDDKTENEIIVSTAILKLFNLSEADIEKGVNDIKMTIIVPKVNAENALSEKATTTEGEVPVAEESKNVEGEVDLKELPLKFKIVGVVKNDNSPYIFLNIANIKDFNVVEFNQLKVKAKTQKDVDKLRSEIFNMGYGVSSISETIDQANKIFAIIQIILAAFGVVALIVSAIGMFNTMTISLLQRTREIGIMKSIGAKNRDVKKLFLTEAFLIGTLGGGAGLAIGFFLQGIFNLLLGLLAKTLGGVAMNIFYTPTWFILLIIGFSSIVGLLTGVWPAIRASKLNPLDALRYK